MAGHIASNRYDPSLWFKIIDIAVKINRVESWWWRIPGSILDGWTSMTKEDNSWFNDYPFLLSFFFLHPVKRDVEGISFPKSYYTKDRFNYFTSEWNWTVFDICANEGRVAIRMSIRIIPWLPVMIS